MKLHQLYRIETERLVLIPMTFEFVSKILRKDKSAYKQLGLKKVKHWPNMDTMRILPLLQERLSWKRAPDGFAAWLFIDKVSKIIVGDGGFKDSPNSSGEIDLGYGIIESKRNQGYASEAVRGLVGWALAQETVKVVTADCLKTNVGSYRVLQKVGMIQVMENEKLVYFRKEK